MAHLIKQNGNIKGLEIYDLITLISQFADDTMLFLSFDTLTLQSVTETL